jgi:predicted metal-binding membrane protein
VSSAPPPDLTTRVLQHQRALTGASVALMAAGAWLYVAASAGSHSLAMPAMSAPGFAPLLAMWFLMMVAMMLPSAAPVVLLYSRVRTIRNADSGIAQTWVFLTGYLAVWLLFSIMAAVSQSLLTGPAMQLDNRWAKAALLLAAGLYQLSSLKFACMRACRSPGEFLSRYWKPGWDGAIRLGLRHGAFCLGCCWLLMALLFVGGVMNLLWIVGLTLLVAAERLLPGGEIIRRVSGFVLLLWGAFVLVA